MVTAIKLSTISYLSDKKTEEVLNELLVARKIRFWCYINHLPEEDEKKEHKHQIVFPDEQLDTRDLDDMFIEKDPKHPDKPFRCIDWKKSSNMCDWILYGIHDPIYCAEKHGEIKKFCYASSDFHCSDIDIFDHYFYMSYHEFDFWKKSKYMELLRKGLTPKDLVTKGYVSMKEMVNFHYFCKSLAMDDLHVQNT